MMDVRQCPEDEIQPLFDKITQHKPDDVSHDGTHCFLTYKSGKQKLSVWVRGWSTASFEFHTGVDNIRFDGWFKESDQIAKFKEHAKDGLGTKVSDFIKL